MILSRRALRVQPSATLAIGAQAIALRQAGKPVLNFGLGEPDFPTPPYVKDAAKRALEDNFTYYTSASGIKELKQAIVDKFSRENGIAYDVTQVLVCNGAKHALMNIFLALLDKCDEVIIPAPYWTSYPEMVKLAEGTPVFCPTNEKFQLTGELFEQAITPKTKVLILNTPSNPTGAMIPKDEMEKIAALCVKHKIFVIADEVYEHFCYNGNHVSIASLGKEIYDLTFTVNAVSKSYSMTGWRIGYIAGPQQIIAKMASMQSQMTSCPNSIAQKGAVAALIGGNAYIKEMTVAFAKRRELMCDLLSRAPGLLCSMPEGAFYLFVKIPGKSQEFCSRLLQEKYVATIPGIAFGAEGYMRLSYATSDEVIKEGCERIVAFCSTI